MLRQVFLTNRCSEVLFRFLVFLDPLKYRAEFYVGHVTLSESRMPFFPSKKNYKYLCNFSCWLLYGFILLDSFAQAAVGIGGGFQHLIKLARSERKHSAAK